MGDQPQRRQRYKLLFLKTADVNKDLPGIGDGSGDAAEKDNTAFHSGEVAWRLQSKQTAAGEGEPALVWGQNLMNEPKDNYPQLRAFDADTPQVYKVAFMNDSEEHDAKYANSGMTVDLPATEPTKEGYTFSYWQDKAGTQVTEPITVTADTTFTAQWTANTYTVKLNLNGGTIVEGNLTSYTYGIGATLQPPSLAKVTPSQAGMKKKISPAIQ